MCVIANDCLNAILSMFLHFKNNVVMLYQFDGQSFSVCITTFRELYVQKLLMMEKTYAVCNISATTGFLCHVALLFF